MSSSRISGMSAASCASLTRQRDRVLLRRPARRGRRASSRETRVRAIRSRASLQIERRQRQRLVVDDLDRRAAAAEHDHGAEGRIVGEAGDQLARLRPQDHRLHDDAGDRASGRSAFARARMSSAAVRTASALVRLSTTPPTSDLWTMSRDMILSTTVAPCANSVDACATACVGVGGRKRRHHRDVVGLEQPLDLERIEPARPSATPRRRSAAPPRYRAQNRSAWLAAPAPALRPPRGGAPDA